MPLDDFRVASDAYWGQRFADSDARRAGSQSPFWRGLSSDDGGQ
jgi:hypothetical protein